VEFKVGALGLSKLRPEDGWVTESSLRKEADIEHGL
jgi:hypothetical protein